MLDPWIIEEIQKREKDRDKHERIQKRIEYPSQIPLPDNTGKQEDSDTGRGVTIIDI